MRALQSIVAICACALLAACQPSQRPETEAAQKPAEHRHARATVYTLDTERSTIALKVYRDGPLARFGHNHANAVTQLSGVVYREKDPLQSDVELSFPAAALTVDRPTDRAAAGADFPGELPPEAIAGTRQNMLGPKLLAAAQYPDIQLRTVAISGQWPDLQLLMEIRVCEFISQVTLPARVSEAGDTLIAEGVASLSQAQLGLTPYSVLGGGLRVRDGIDVQYHLVAVRSVPAASPR